MDLADLLAREGYAETDLTRLLVWARARAEALLAEADVAPPLRQLLGGDSGHVPQDMPQASADEPAPVDEPAPPAVSEEDIPIDLRRAVTAATAPHPVAAAAAEDDDAESGIGGFARFGGISRMKNRPYPFRQESEPEERPTIAHSFALAAEKAAEERDAPAAAKPPAAAAAAAHPAELSGTLPMAALGISAEESGGLVLGIPDDDATDVPVSRARSASSSVGVPRASGPNRSGALVDDDDEPAVGALVDDDEPPPNPLAVTDDELSATALAGLTEATDSELLAVDDVLSESSSPAPPLAPPEPVPAVISEPSGVDLSRPIAVSTREPTGPRDAHVEQPEAHDDPQAPVLRRRTPKKKIVELGAPVGRPRGSSGTATVVPKSSPHGPRKPPPPPPPGRKPTPRHEEIEELSRVELIDDIPSYLRDDED